jgi:hypothetical protein
MSKRMIRARGAGDGVLKHQPPSLGFCTETGCLEFAQVSDPECPDTLKFKCAKHEIAARARGETGIRAPVLSEFQELAGSNARFNGQISTPDNPAQVFRTPPAWGRPVVELDDAGGLVQRWETAAAAAEALDVARAALSESLRKGYRSGGRRVAWEDEWKRSRELSAGKEPACTAEPIPAELEISPPSAIPSEAVTAEENMPSGSTDVTGSEPSAPPGRDGPPPATDCSHSFDTPSIEATPAELSAIDPPPPPTPNPKRKERIPVKPPKPIEAIDEEGKRHAFPTAIEAAAFTGVAASAARKCAHTDGKWVKCRATGKRWTFAFVDGQASKQALVKASAETLRVRGELPAAPMAGTEPTGLGRALAAIAGMAAGLAGGGVVLSDVQISVDGAGMQLKVGKMEALRA